MVIVALWFLGLEIIYRKNKSSGNLNRFFSMSLNGLFWFVTVIPTFLEVIAVHFTVHLQKGALRRLNLFRNKIWRFCKTDGSLGDISSWQTGEKKCWYLIGTVSFSLQLLIVQSSPDNSSMLCQGLRLSNIISIGHTFCHVNHK